MSCRNPEPIPESFYAPAHMGEEIAAATGAKWLGEYLYSPGAGFRYQVISPPLCRIYWGSGKPEPHSFESSYYHNGKGWKRDRPNHLSYLIAARVETYLTVRWK